MYVNNCACIAKIIKIKYHQSELFPLFTQWKHVKWNNIAKNQTWAQNSSYESTNNLISDPRSIIIPNLSLSCLFFETFSILYEIQNSLKKDNHNVNIKTELKQHQ